MAAITYSNDGLKIFIATEDVPSGYQFILSADTSDLTDWTPVYTPGGGSASNVTATASDPDILFFYGNFGTDVGIIKHTISTGANTDISPASVGSKTINVIESNPTPLPDGSIELVCHIDTAQDLVYSDDTGTTWTAWDSATGATGTALDVFWRGTYFIHGYLLGGEATGGKVYVSPNEGANSADVTDTITATDICSVEFVGT